MSHLHARKKSVHSSNNNNAAIDSVNSSGGGDAEAPLPPSGSPHRQHGIRKRRLFHHLQTDSSSSSSSEPLMATLSVVGFLATGLMLGYFLLHHQHRKVILHVMRDPVGHIGRGVLRGRQGFRHHFYSGNPRYVTVVLPSVVNPQGRTKRLEAIQDTWGGSARAIYVVHNVSTEFPQASHAVLSDTTRPEDRYAYPQLLLVPPDITVEDGVPRLIHTIRTIHTQVNPDFAFFVNDHTYVIPAHVCKYLHNRDPNHDMYHGHALRNGKSEIFNSGAAGYLLSRATMHKLVERFDSGNDANCGGGNGKQNKWLQGNPGLVTLKCLNSLGIYATDTRSSSKWHRFHAFPLMRTVSGQVDQWYRNKHEEMDQISGAAALEAVAAAPPPTFDASYNTLLQGPDCCSTDTISFHYVECKEAQALFAVQERLLEHPHLSDKEIKILMQAEWPTSSKDIGFYSKALPHDDETAAWSALIATIRKISTRNTQRDC